MNKLFIEAKELYAYEISGQYDLKEMADEPEDGIWCSIFDVCKLASYGIIEPLEKEDFDQAVDFLEASKIFTKHHQKDVVAFA